MSLTARSTNGCSNRSRWQGRSRHDYPAGLPIAPIIRRSKVNLSDRLTLPQADTRGGSPPQEQGSQVSQSIQSVYLPIKRAAERSPSPENNAALAVFDIVQGRPEAAVPRLRKAHADKPSDPRFLNDLAAASLAVYEDNGDPWAALEAIEMAAQADRLEPSPPARFNMALALERLDVRVRAIAAWERYLEARFQFLLGGGGRATSRWPEVGGRESSGRSTAPHHAGRQGHGFSGQSLGSPPARRASAPHPLGRANPGRPAGRRRGCPRAGG